MKLRALGIVAINLAIVGFLIFGPGDVAEAHSATSSVTCTGGVNVHANANYEGDATNNKLTITVGGVTTTYMFGSGGTDQTVPVPQGGATTAWSWSIDANINTGNSTAYDEYHEGNVGPCGQPVVITPTVLYTPPTCTAIGTLSFPPSQNYTVTNNGNGTFTFVANPGSAFPPGFQVTVGPFPIAQLIGEVCGTTTTSSSTTTTTTCPDCTPNTQAVTTTTQPGTTTSTSTTTTQPGIPPITNPATVSTTSTTTTTLPPAVPPAGLPETL